MGLAFDLTGRGGQQVDVGWVRRSAEAGPVRSTKGRHAQGGRGPLNRPKRVRRRDVGRSEVRRGRRSREAFGRRRRHHHHHHRGAGGTDGRRVSRRDRGARHDCASGPYGGRGRGRLLGLMVSPGVGIVVDPRVSGQLVGPTEALGAAGKVTGVWLLARVGPDVSGLMLQPMEGLVAPRTLVGSREVGSMLASGVRLGATDVDWKAGGRDRRRHRVRVRGGGLVA